MSWLASIDKRTWYSPSAIALLLANLVPLYGVLYLDWSVLALMVLLWLEVILIALFTVLRMLCADPANLALWVSKAIFVPVFGLLAAYRGVYRFLGVTLVVAITSGLAFSDPLT